MQSKFDQIENMVTLQDIELLESYNSGELDYCAGNLDDAFEVGFEVGFTQAVLKIIEILEK